MKSYRASPLVAAIALSTFSGNAFAATFFCVGSIETVGVSDGVGQLYVKYGGHPIQTICHIGGTVNGILPETCRAWYAMLLAADAQGKRAAIYYDSAAPGNPASCSFSAWAAYKPYFVEMVP